MNLKVNGLATWNGCPLYTYVNSASSSSTYGLKYPSTSTIVSSIEVNLITFEVVDIYPNIAKQYNYSSLKYSKHSYELVYDEYGGTGDEVEVP